jgi:hypothetical protein
MFSPRRMNTNHVNVFARDDQYNQCPYFHQGGSNKPRQCFRQGGPIQPMSVFSPRRTRTDNVSIFTMEDQNMNYILFSPRRMKFEGLVMSFGASNVFYGRRMLISSFARPPCHNGGTRFRHFPVRPRALTCARPQNLTRTCPTARGDEAARQIACARSVRAVRGVAARTGCHGGDLARNFCPPRVSTYRCQLTHKPS